MQQVIQQVKLVHDPLTSQEVRSQADRFLYETFFQNEQCWSILIEILQTGDLPTEIHFFAAQFLRTKMAKSFRQLPRKQLSSLEELLLQLIKPFTQAPIILKQMGLVIADFSVQRPDWQDVVGSLVKSLYPDHTIALLNILNCLPEEINSGRIPLAPPQKDAIKKVYRSCAPQVLSFLEQVWSNLKDNDVSNRRLVLECFASWSRVFQQIDATALLNSSLFLSCFQAVEVQQTFTHACTALVEIIPISSTQEGRQWAEIQQMMIKNVLKLSDFLAKAIQQEDADSTYHLSRLFVMVSQAYKAQLCQNPENLFKMLQITIEITRQKDIHVSQQAFRFWTSLMEDRYEHDYRDKPDPTQSQAAMYRMAASEALKAIIDSIQYPQDFDTYDEEQFDEWYEHRQYGTEVISDLLRYLDPEVFTQVVVNRLEGPLSKWPQTPWQDLESCFHALNQTRSAKTKQTQDMFKQIIEVALQIKHNPQMQETITWLISSYSDLASQYNSLCQPMIYYCLEGLLKTTHKRIIRASAETLRDICKFSPDAAKLHLPTLLEVYKQISTGNSHLQSSEICDFVWAICETFQSIGIDDVKKAMESLMEKPLQCLEISLKENNVEKVHFFLKVISEVFRRTNLHDNVIRDGKHPLVQSLEAIWKYLSEVMKRYNTNNDIMEKTTRIIKSTIRGASQHFVQSALAEKILEQVVSIYKSSSKSCFLYLISVYVDEYGQLESTQELFEGCLLQILEKTSTLLTDLASFTNDPDLVEDFFELLIRYFKRCPKILLKEQYLIHVLDLALCGIRIRHADASRAILLYIQTMIRQGTDQLNSREKSGRMVSHSVSPEAVQLIGAILSKRGQNLMAELVLAITTISHRYLEDYVQILEAWYQLDTRHLRQNLELIISRLEIDPVFPTKSEFVKKYFSTTMSQDNHRREIIKEFSSACDRFQQTQTYHKR